MCVSVVKVTKLLAYEMLPWSQELENIFVDDIQKEIVWEGKQLCENGCSSLVTPSHPKSVYGCQDIKSSASSMLGESK